MKAYKIYNTENKTEYFFGKGQLVEFATREIADNESTLTPEKLQLNFEPSEIKILIKIRNEVKQGKTISSLKHAKLVLRINNYKIQEIDLY